MNFEGEILGGRGGRCVVYQNVSVAQPEVVIKKSVVTLKTN